MGQQQLLLLVLGVVIVALTVVVGLPIFQEQIKKDSADRAAAAALVLSSKAIDWKLRSPMYGGGQDVPYLTGMTLSTLGFEVTGTDGQGEYYQTDQLIYRVRRVNSPIPRMQVRDLNGMSQVEVGMYGPTANCLVIRKKFRRGSLGNESSTDDFDTGLPPMPGDCNGW